MFTLNSKYVPNAKAMQLTSKTYASHMTIALLEKEVDVVTPSGRPTLRYMDTIRRYIKKNGLTDVNILDRN